MIKTNLLLIESLLIYFTPILQIGPILTLNYWDAMSIRYTQGNMDRYFSNGLKKRRKRKHYIYIYI